MADCAYLVQNTPGLMTGLERRTQEPLWLLHDEHYRWGRRRQKLFDLRMSCQIQERAQEQHQLPCKWETNEIQSRAEVKEWSERVEHRRGFVYAALMVVSSILPFVHTAVCASDSRLKGLSSFRHNSNSSSLWKDKPWHQNSGSSHEDNSSLCRRRAEAWPGRTEAPVSGAGGLSSCLNLCLYLRHIHSFNPSGKLT